MHHNVTAFYKGFHRGNVTNVAGSNRQVLIIVQFMQMLVLAGIGNVGGRDFYFIVFFKKNFGEAR